MFFIPPPEGFTNHARFYGIPCYVKMDEDGMAICGTNVVTDWLTLHFSPLCHSCVEYLRALRDGVDYEPGGFQVEILGTIKREA